MRGRQGMWWGTVCAWAFVGTSAVLGCRAEAPEATGDPERDAPVVEAAVPPAPDQSNVPDPAASTPSPAPEYAPDRLPANALLVGVMFRDGTFAPIGMHADGEWSVPWTTPFGRDQPAPPVWRLPEVWTLHVTGSDPVAVRLGEPVLKSAYCVRNWAYRTDWPEQQPADPRRSPQVIGMMVHPSVPVLPEDSLPDVRARREALGITSNEQEGEGYRSVRPLGYLRVADRLVGVVLWRGYEGESYRVYDFDRDARAPVAELHGGGC